MTFRQPADREAAHAAIAARGREAHARQLPGIRLLVADSNEVPLTVKPAPGNPRFPMLDSIRGLAVLAVVTFHVCAITNALSHEILGRLVMISGVVAVNCFFVMSGFLLYRPFIARVPRQKRIGALAVEFLWRRLLRIVPAYWVALLVLGIGLGLSGVLSEDWYKYFLFVQIYDVKTYGGGIPVAWTLAIEMSFYWVLAAWIVAFGLLSRTRSHRAWIATQAWVLLALAVASGVFRFWGQQENVPRTLTGTILGQGQWLCVGMLAAIGSVAAMKEKRGSHGTGERLLRLLAVAVKGCVDRPGMCWLGALASGAVAATLLPGAGLGAVVRGVQGDYALERAAALEVGIGLATLCFVLPGMAAQRWRSIVHRMLTWRITMVLGAISYGVYLWHLPIAEMLGTDGAGRFAVKGAALWNSPRETPVLWVVTVIGSVLIAYVSYRFIEVPALRLRDNAVVGRLWNARKGQ